MFESCHPDIMIQAETKLKVSDNSGVLKVKCICNLGGFKHNISGIGNCIRVSILDKEEESKIESKMALAYISNVKKKYRRLDGSYIRFDENKVILFFDKQKIVGNRVNGPLPYELLKNVYLRSTIISSKFV